MSDDRPKKRVWDSYISEPFLSKVAQQREPTLITKNSALLVIDLYNLVFEGGKRSLQEEGLLDQFPATCGEKAYQAIKPTNQLISLFRDRALPIFFSTKDFEKAQKGIVPLCVYYVLCFSYFFSSRLFKLSTRPGACEEGWKKCLFFSNGFSSR